LSAEDRALGALLGLAVGDAVGTTVEFKPRGSFAPLTDMVGGGPFNLEPGQWTDDTSMALCLAASLVETGAFDAHDQMRRYLRWRDEGYMSSNGRCFDIGTTVSAALRRYERTGDPFAGSTDPMSAGNGSIMRLAPVVLRYVGPNFSSGIVPSAALLTHAVDSSRTTHAAPECLDACRLLAAILSRALAGVDKADALLGDAATFSGTPAITALARGDWREKSERHIAGTGYVVESLEAALWSVWTTETFEAAILRAANLGDDADTTAAVAGQIAGALYGSAGIPPRWLDRLAMRDEIVTIAKRL
jgi:ADP-ribosyl-[dinitrogen reductase] hydrolase